MPNTSGSNKRKKRKEKAKKVEALQPADATCSELPYVVGAEALSISGDREPSETKENSTEHDHERNIDRNEKSENLQEAKKKKKKKKKKSGQKDESSDNTLEKEDSVPEKSNSLEVKENSVPGNSSGTDSCDRITVAESTEVERQEISAHEQPDVIEERNFARLIRLLMGVGADCLRNYFLKIHPTWSNQPSDASALKKGVLKIQKHQQAKYYAGDINEWDVSLLISVLRFSDLSSREVSRYPDIDDALRGIQEIRNTVIAHASDKKISAADFKTTWEKLESYLVAIGGSKDDIDATLTDYTERALEQYRQFFLEKEVLQQIFSDHDREKIEDVTSYSDKEHFEEIHPTPEWDAWLKFLDQMDGFNTSQTQFVLLTDVMAQMDLENFKVLAAIPWKMVIDFNPSSEDDGLYKMFKSQTSLQQVISPFTPGEILKVGYAGLPKQIDSKRTQWLFANGRKEDAEGSKPRSFPEWERKSVRNITMFFLSCASIDLFDIQKPIRCLLLPVSRAALPFVEVTIKRFKENFPSYDISFASIDTVCKRSSCLEDVQTFQLSSTEMKNGLVSLFNVTDDVQKYNMPCFQSGIPVPFPQKDYVYISEYLELFYIGCEQKFINSNDEEEERNIIEEEHRKCFLSGDIISFLSLYFNHDAKRQIEKDIEVHIQRMLDQRMLKHSGIVQIAHPPGTGGSTIARRVLWNLHESFPCASVQLSNQTKLDDDSNFINELCSRILILEDQCGFPPVILVDGRSQWRIHALSNRIVRTLNSLGKRAVILECYRSSKPANAEVHKVFSVDAALEKNPADLKEFKEKFREANRYACRVFHFPLLSMMEEFREKLEEIVKNTLNELDDLENDVAAFVAFFQLYAEQRTPAILVYEAFKSRFPISKGVHVTYEGIKKCFSDSLLNLMVCQEKRRGKNDCIKQYTLQHHLVATFLFNKYLENKKQTLYEYVYEFLKRPISNIKRFVDMYCDLLLFNKGGDRKLRFSVLIDQLGKCNQKQAATVLRIAAEIIPDPRVCGHAARFHAKMTRPKFKEAKELIEAGIKLSESHGRVKSIHDSKGVVLSLELKHRIRCEKVKDINELTELADKALVEFRAARDFPPTFPSPLIGEVQVWISCIKWITDQHQGDADEAVKFIISKAPPFFRTCIGDSFYLLDLVDQMVFSLVTMNADPDEIRDRAQGLRISLMTAVRPKIFDGRRRGNISDSLLSIAPGLNLPKMPWKESKRVRTGILLSIYRREQQSFKSDDMKELMKLLEDMVRIEKDFSFAPHFLQLCLEGNGPRTLNLEQVWKVCRDWLEIPDCLDPKRYYFSMVIAFVQILNGRGHDGYFTEYKSLVAKLKEASRGHCRRNQSLHFLKKQGDGISWLISSQSLLSDESSYKTEDSDVVKSFWMVESHRKLKECTGRLRVRDERNKKVTKIELLEGEIELYVGKYAEIGIPGKDFDKDAKVYFVVSFNLIGPVANGITFHPTVEPKNGASLT